MAKKIIVAIHGIGDQFRYETIQSVANQVCQYYGQPAAIPLGRFHSKLYTPGLRGAHELPDDRSGLKALVLKAPPFPELPVDVEIGFDEVYWADVPHGPAKDEHTLEESKKWAKTIVERIRLNYQGKVDNREVTKKNYMMAATVLQEMIDTVAVLERLLFLAEKAGILKFDLSKVLVDYLGDVQIVTEYEYYRKQILKIFDDVMTDIHQNDPEAEIYIIAHSEGTVIAFLGLLSALHSENRPAWIKSVRGFMTIGSPINKHIILWPELFEKLKNPTTPLAQPIEWRNYYDFGDPIGFRLDAARDWLADFGWTKQGTVRQPFFNFNGKVHGDDVHDMGFARYWLPGKAHNDYWNDPDVFGHFIQKVVKPHKPAAIPHEIEDRPKDFEKPPRSKWWCELSPLIPYGIVMVLIYVAVYLLYKGVGEVIHAPQPQSANAVDKSIHAPQPFWVVIGNVAGLAALLGSVTVAACMPRLTRLWRWYWFGWLLFVMAALVYGLVVSLDTRNQLGSWFFSRDQLSELCAKLNIWQPGAWATDNLLRTSGVLLASAAVALIVPLFSGRWPYWGGTRLLVLAGGGLVLLIVANLIYSAHDTSNFRSGPLWPLVLAYAAFIYLWWLAALIFDLAFVWHRYIRYSVIDDRLREICKVKKPHAVVVEEKPPADR